jgi:predicted signal transduction protein with EAL and GGDEF domain
MYPKRMDQHQLSGRLTLESLMEAAGDVVLRADGNGKIFYASRRAQSAVAASGALVGAMLADCIVAEDREALAAALLEAREIVGKARVNARLNPPAGPLWFEWQITACESDKEPFEFLILAHDIAEQHATEERLRHMATHDGLTGLPNRSLLSDRLRMAIAQSKRTSAGFTVLALDLDGFKKVNDALGHPIGDALLRVAAVRFREVLRTVDTLARVGGDEFVAVLPAAVDPAEI